MGALRPGVLTIVFERTLDATRNAGPTGYIVFGALISVVAASGILPASLLGIAAGSAYGVLLGFPLAAVSTMAGAVAAFGLSRSLFRDAVARQLARRPRLTHFDELVARDGWRIVCLLRISPVMPFAATSYALGMSAVGIEAYLIGTAASLPALLGYVYLGTLADAGLLGLDDRRGPVTLGHAWLRRIGGRTPYRHGEPRGAPRLPGRILCDQSALRSDPSIQRAESARPMVVAAASAGGGLSRTGKPITSGQL